MHGIEPTRVEIGDGEIEDGRRNLQDGAGKDGTSLGAASLGQRAGGKTPGMQSRCAVKGEYWDYDLPQPNQIPLPSSAKAIRRRMLNLLPCFKSY